MLKVSTVTVMEAIQAAKHAADQAFRQQQYQQAIHHYGEALQASEDSLIARLLHVLYSNRYGRQQGLVHARRVVGFHPQKAHETKTITFSDRSNSS
jgi:hypothetical protein